MLLLLDTIQALGDSCQYQAQGELYLKLTDTAMTIKHLPNARYSMTGGWVYQVRMTNAKGYYGFKFYGSIADKKAGNHPTPYDVLACVESMCETIKEARDVYHGCGFDEYTLRALVKQSKGLKRIFTEEEVDALNAIV